MRKLTRNKIKKPELNRIVVTMGGVVKFSQLLDVPHSSVSRWLYTDIPIPIKHVIKIEKLTKGKIKAKDLRPDIFKRIIFC